MSAANSAPELAALRNDGKAAVAAALSLIEQKPLDDAVVDLLEEAFANPKGLVIGITGPPGAGKSTLINALLREWRGRGVTVAVLAIDPSSRATRGALLGDRVRMRTDPMDDGVFIRSIAARDRLGGLADIAYPATILLRAIYDRVIVESVGVGQSETDIANVSDTVVLCVQPGSGDSLQFMKAGIVEIPHIAIVTKADIGAVATRALADLEGALGLALREADAFEPHCLALSAIAPSGVDLLLGAIDTHRQWLCVNDRLHSKRRRQAEHWLKGELVTSFGKKGLEVAFAAASRFSSSRPFAAVQKILAQLQVVIREA